MGSFFVSQLAMLINNAVLNDEVHPVFNGTSKVEMLQRLRYLVHDLLNNIFMEINGNVFCFCIHTTLHELTTLFPVFRVLVVYHLFGDRSLVKSRTWEVGLFIWHAFNSPGPLLFPLIVQSCDKCEERPPS